MFSCSTSAPSFVRLGDQDLESNRDAQPANYDIDEFIKHPNYSAGSKHNDIALIRLKGDVVFNNFIRPACIQQDDHFKTTLVAVSCRKEKFSSYLQAFQSSRQDGVK